MYCPKCSHQAVSNNVRYCPGCGFWLQGVTELIANNDLSAAGEEKPPKPRRSMVKRGALFGATLMFIGGLLVMMPLARTGSGDLGVAYIIYGVALISVIGMSSYLKRLFTKFFSEEEPSPSKKIASPRGPSLPEAYSEQVVNSGRQLVDTSKMAQPSSITEQTTSRFNKA